MGSTAQAASAGPASGPLARLGFSAGQVVQELGWDDDVDDDVRLAIEEVTTTELQDEDYGDVADAVVVWFRASDDDLFETLVDALTNLAEGGFVVLLTPKAGRPEHVDASEIEEAALTAGLHTAGSANVSPEWGAVRLVAPRGQRR